MNDQQLVALFEGLDTPGVSDAMDKLGIAGQCLGIAPLDNYRGTVVGPAFQYAGSRGIAATVIDGVCRDVSKALGDGYPIFSKGRYMRAGKDRVQVASVNQPVAISGARVCSRDIVVADANGVLVVPRARAEEVARSARQIEEVESQNQCLAQAKPSATYRIIDRVAARRAEGAKIISLCAGEPDFDTPQHIRQAGIDAIRNGHTRYTQVAGVRASREVVACSDEDGFKLTPKVLSAAITPDSRASRRRGPVRFPNTPPSPP